MLKMKSKDELKQLIKKIKWGKEKEMPFSQGWAINKVIKKYKIPAKKWGYDYDVIGVQTKKQRMLWRDAGTKLEFLGLEDL